MRRVKKQKLPKRFRKEREQAEQLLLNLAQVLNACDKANFDIKLEHGIVLSEYGYVMPIRRGWTVRMRVPSLRKSARHTEPMLSAAED